MLQRAATNAYSWWWASHIRTKQTKWLEQSLNDMEVKVEEALQILDETGDTFAQRAEMFYRKRMELVCFVEEAFRGYRALAERYDHLSKELQSANRTIANVFPEQVQYRIDDDDYDASVPGSNNASSLDPCNQTPQKPAIPNNKVPNVPKKEFRCPSMLLSRKGQHRRVTSAAKPLPIASISGLSKAEVTMKIDKLQKEMLGLQTEKEFVRSLYERSYDKYWEIEDQITGMQKSVCDLQDEFGVGTIIEDNDARALMAATALNSCKETLAKLQEVQALSSDEAKAAYQRVKEAHDRFESLRDQFLSKHSDQLDEGIRTEPSSNEEEIEEEIVGLEGETHDVEISRETVKEKLEQDSDKSMNMTEMAELIDELVNKVVALETSVSSQSGLVQRLISEAEELQKSIQALEEDKEMLIQDSEKTNKKLKELEEELRRVKLLNRNVRMQDNSLQTHFTEASFDVEHLSAKLNTVKHSDEEGENSALYKKRSATDGKPKEQSEHRGDNLAITKDVNTTNEAKFSNVMNEDNMSSSKENIDFRTASDSKIMHQDKDDLPKMMSNLGVESAGEEEDQRDWRQKFVSGLDDREKILLEEYTSVLKDYRDVKAKLNDVEGKNRESILELALQVKELQDDVATKDKVIYFLQQKLISPETNPDETPKSSLTEYKYTPHEALLRIAAQGINMQELEIPSPYMNSSARTSCSDQQLHSENKGVGDFGMSPSESILEKMRGNFFGHRHSLSTTEKRFRSTIDGFLEENLEFWLRFSTSIHQIQKFQNSIHDLKTELRQIKDYNMSEGNSNSTQSEMKAIFRHLREIRTELTLWLEHNAVLQEELQGRHPTLVSLQDEIARAANPESASMKAVLSEYQAAKFQGEVLNMKQENNRVSSELQAGLSFVKGLKSEVEKMLEGLCLEIEVNNNRNVAAQDEQMKQHSTRTRIPLKSFLFGVKLKKQRQSTIAKTEQ